MKTIKVLAGSLAAITAGATLALGIFAAPITSLGDYVKVSGSALNSPVIVIGDGATASSGFAQDVVGAADIAAAVAGYATTTVSTGAVGLGVSNGAEVGTTNTKIYLGDALTKSGVKSTLTKSELPTLLSSGSLTDTAGTTYNYDQYLTLQGGSSVIYGNSGGDLTDPDLTINLSSTSGAGVINYSITFNKLLNISSTNIHNKKLKLLGVDYTIGSTSTIATVAAGKLVLYGSSLVQTMAGGEEKKVTVDNVEYTVKVLGTSSATSAAVSVNGESQTVNKGTSYLISGLAVYVEDVFHLSSTDQTQNSVKLSFGTNKLTLENGATVKKGTSDDTVDGTLVKLTGTDNNGLSKIEISIAAKDSSHDHAKQGAENAFSDPVFGAFKLALGGLNGGSTETITIDNSGTTGASIKFTDYRGKEKTLSWAYTGSTSFAADLNSTSTSNMVVIENGSVKKNDYVILTPSQESEFSHIVQYTTASSLGSSGAYFELRDAMSDATSRFYLTDAGYGTGTFYLDGQAYYAKNASASSSTDFRFTWGTGASVGAFGDLITVYPLVKTSKGGWLTFVPGNATRAISLAENRGGAAKAIYELPSGYVAVTANATANWIVVTDSTGTADGTFSDYNVNASGALVQIGRIKYNISSNNETGAVSNMTVFSLESGGRPQYPAVLFKEEKGKNTANTDVQDFVIVTIKDGTGSGVDLTMDQPTLTASTQYSQSLQSDNSVTSYMDRYGTAVKYDSDSQGLVEITYPDEQAVATVAVGSSPAFGAGGAGTVQQAVKITSPVAKLAAEVSTTAPGADLILVGGPCANSLVAKLLAASNVTCDSWSYTTGIIKEVTGGFTDGSRALIVAGTTAADTRALAAKLISGTLSYEA